MSGSRSSGRWTLVPPFQSRRFIWFATCPFLTKLFPSAWCGRCMHRGMAKENRRNRGTGVCSRKLFFPEEGGKVGRNIDLPSLPSSVPAAAPGWSFVAPSRPWTHCLQEKELRLPAPLPPNSLSVLQRRQGRLRPGCSLPASGAPRTSPGPGPSPRGLRGWGRRAGPGPVPGGQRCGSPRLPRARPPRPPRPRRPGGKGVTVGVVVVPDLEELGGRDLHALQVGLRRHGGRGAVREGGGAVRGPDSALAAAGERRRRLRRLLPPPPRRGLFMRPSRPGHSPRRCPPSPRAPASPPRPARGGRGLPTAAPRLGPARRRSPREPAPLGVRGVCGCREGNPEPRERERAALKDPLGSSCASLAVENVPWDVGTEREHSAPV